MPTNESIKFVSDNKNLSPVVSHRELVLVVNFPYRQSENGEPVLSRPLVECEIDLFVEQFKAELDRAAAKAKNKFAAWHREAKD